MPLYFSVSSADYGNGDINVYYIVSLEALNQIYITL